MIPKRLASTIATGLWVAGALLIGNALHVSVVTGQVPLTAPAPVFYTIGGIALILISQNLDVHPSEYLDYLESGDEEEEAAEQEQSGAEFDEAASPLDEEAMANLEARERERERRESKDG
ncbi:hypothetical protein [Haloparvum sp. PAK95]|uniref:hypothetical protein n=1 Tax=Haloparvum sp. PAK95 TaxID=3418962 RepID=UPI003D2E9FF0